MTLHQLAAAFDFAPILPSAWQRFAPLLREALLYFLGHLNPIRRDAILQEQLALSPDVSFSERMFRLAHLSPTLHKLGQVVARDARLPHELRSMLQQLESMPPRFSIAEARALLREEGISCEDSTIRLGSAPLAEASVAVVVPFQLTTPPRSGNAVQHGVFKILKPQIEEWMQEELQIYAELGEFLDQRAVDQGIPSIDYSDTFSDVAELLAMEIQLDKEQEHLALAAQRYENDRRVSVPHLLPFCTPRVTSMERLFGTKVTDLPRDWHLHADRVAQTIVDALVAQVMWAPTGRAIFHADPHAGNLMWTRDDKLGILDWSLMGQLDRRSLELMMQLLVAALLLDEPAAVTTLQELSCVQTSPELLRRLVRTFYRKLCCGERLGMDWLIQMLDEAVATAGVRFASQLTLFRKALFTLEGVVRDVARYGTFDDMLVAAGCAQWIREWPARCQCSLRSRELGIKLSTQEIATAICQLPWLPWRAVSIVHFRT